MTNPVDKIMTFAHDELEGSGLSFALLLWKPGLATGTASIGYAVWPQLDPEAGAAMRMAADKLGAEAADPGQQIMNLLAGHRTDVAISRLADCLATTVGGIYARAGKSPEDAQRALAALQDSMAAHVVEHWGHLGIREPVAGDLDTNWPRMDDRVHEGGQETQDD